MIQPHLPVRLPCYDFTPVTNPTLGILLQKVRVTTSGITSFHGVTGGVYKARERIHRCIADQRLLAIPLSTLVAIICMKLFGLSINVFSLGGLALGVGIVVDNSIVMLENIALKVNQNQNKRDFLEIARNSSQEVESALLASTATNLVSILPFLLLGGFISLLFNEIILTISFAVAASFAAHACCLKI